jgi:hypothetical protein
MKIKSMLFIYLTSIFSCTSKEKEGKDVAESKNYLFETYQKDSSFKKYICEGNNFSNKDIALTNLKRKNIGLQDITNGTDGFEFGFCFSNIDTISYYLVFGEKNRVNFSKLYRIIYSNNEIERGQYPTDSFKIKPKSGWPHFLNELYKLKTHRILNEMHPSLPGLMRNNTGRVPFVIVEFANKNIYRMYQWSRVLVNLKDEQNVLFDSVIKLLYEEFNLKKSMPLFWKNVKEQK